MHAFLELHPSDGGKLIYLDPGDVSYFFDADTPLSFAPLGDAEYCHVRLKCGDQLWVTETAEDVLGMFQHLWEKQT